jgi:uncharacterized protein YkwD
MRATRPSIRASRSVLALAFVATTIAPGLARADRPDLAWKPATRSPAPASVAEARDAALLAICGAPDRALMDLAARDVAAEVGGAAIFPADELAFGLRAAGDPHVWPRAWSVAGASLAEDDLARRVRAWVGSFGALGVRRCGVARGTAADGTHVVAAVTVDALADMAPLPTTANVGQWLTLEGTMLVPATEAKVVLLGPRGAPKTVLASLSHGKLHAAFSVDQPGAWLVQVLATVSTGPRPVLEAMVFAGSPPPRRFVRASAPGEAAARRASDDADAVLRMVNAARAAEGLPALTRDAALDALAADHSAEMMRVKMVGHDTGSGDPASRIRAAGVRARVAGENVSSASSLENAHRALWSSPSHRGNLLFDRFTRMGVGVTRDKAGTVWVTELFAG